MNKEQIGLTPWLKPVSEWLTTYTKEKSVVEDNKDEPEEKLRNLVSGTIEEFAIGALRCNYLSTWYLACYEYGALIDRNIDYNLLGLSSRYLSTYIAMQSCFAKMCRRATVLMPEAALAMSMPVVLGWHSDFLSNGRLILQGLDNSMLDLVRHDRHSAGEVYRHFWFCIQLYAQYQDINIDTKRYSYPADMTPYGEILRIWRTRDIDHLGQRIEEAASYHLREARIPMHDEVFEFDTEDRMLFPYEILLLLRIREWEGLPNPTEFSHPLLNQPLASMPAHATAYPAVPLLEDVIIKFNARYSTHIDPRPTR